jgi:hypothetical protein
MVTEIPLETSLDVGEKPLLEGNSIPRRLEYQNNRLIIRDPNLAERATTSTHMPIERSFSNLSIRSNNSPITPDNRNTGNCVVLYIYIYLMLKINPIQISIIFRAAGIFHEKINLSISNHP